MTENYCHRDYMGREIKHNTAIVNFEQIRRFNDNTDEGKYNLTYMCEHCWKDWTIKDVLLFDRPIIDSELRDRYRFKKRTLPTREKMGMHLNRISKSY